MNFKVIVVLLVSVLGNIALISVLLTRHPATSSACAVAQIADVPEVTHTVTVTKVVTVHDGQPITTVTTTNATDTKPVVLPPLQQPAEERTRYAVSVLSDPMNFKDVAVDISARLGNLPVHAVVGVYIMEKIARIGLRYEW